MNTLNELFAFLQIQMLLDMGKDNAIVQHIMHLCKKYSDLNAAAMTAKLYYIRCYIVLFKEVHSEIRIPTLICCIIKWKLQENLSNIFMSLRIILTVAVSNASCETIFSKIEGNQDIPVLIL